MMEEHIGFPEYILNSVQLDKEYEHVSRQIIIIMLICQLLKHNH